MSLPTSGRVSHDQFPRVFGSLINQRFTGVLRLVDAGRLHGIYWSDGTIVDADSTAPEDQVGRVAIETGIVDPGAISDSIRRLAQQPNRTQKEILIEMGALTRDNIARLERLVLTKRSLHVFALPNASFVVSAEDHGREEGGPVEARWMLYRGLKEHYDERRLLDELADLGDKAMKLAPEAKGILDLFGFRDEERILTGYLDKGYWELHDIVEACMTMPRQVVLAGVAALRAVEALDVQLATKVSRLRKRARETTVQMGRDTSEILPMGTAIRPPGAVSGPTPTRAPSAAPRGQSSSVPPAQVPPPRASGTAPPVRKMSSPHPPISPPNPQSPSSPLKKISGNSASLVTATPGGGIAAAIREQIAGKLAQLEEHADHFAVLELERNATAAQIKASYLALAKTYHPDSLARVKLEMFKPQATRIFQRITDAYAVIFDDTRRREYLQVLAQGGEHALRRRADDEAARAGRVVTAEAHFNNGEMALRRQMWSNAIEEFQRAIDLNETEAEHHALLAWAKWCATSDKAGIFPEVKKGLVHAIDLNSACVPALYYLGQVYNARGELNRAYDYFHRVLAVNSSHVDAKREVRLIEMRRAKGGDKKGLFDFLRKK